MVGYKLDDTLSDYGSVSRGICNVDENMNLKKIVETTKIVKRNSQVISIEENGRERLLSGKENVSMNIWGFKPTVFSTIENKFINFLEKEINKPKSEMYIPSVVYELIDEKLREPRENYERLMSAPQHLEEILQAGAERVRPQSIELLAEVRDAVGLRPYTK